MILKKSRVCITNNFLFQECFDLEKKHAIIKMTDFLFRNNFNHICILILLYNIWNSEYINIILNKLYLLNYTSILIMINIIGVYLFLKNITFEIKIGYNL
jgi:hypothetical protein